MFEFDQPIRFPGKETDLLTIGELLIDLISADYGDINECNTYVRYFGGSPSNIAMNATKLGIHSLVASAVGKDGFGDFLLQCLQHAGIRTQCVQQVDYSTSIVVVTKSKSTPVPIFYRAADYHLAFTPELKASIRNSKIIHFSCWPLSRMPVRGTIESVMEEARKHNVLIGFDPNYHPMIWQEGEDGTDYVKSVIGKVDIVKPSQDDAERLFGKDTHENQIQKYLGLGAKLVVMTLGEDGAIVSNGKETITFHSFAREVVDTTGAGDAFWSGFYTALVKGYTLKNALASGFAVSAFKLRYSGAVVDLPKLEEVQAMYDL